MWARTARAFKFTISGWAGLSITEISVGAAEEPREEPPTTATTSTPLHNVNVQVVLRVVWNIAIYAYPFL